MRKLVFLILTLTAINIIGSQPDLKFIRHTTDNGLSHNEVLSICQDTLGFLWFGTKNGCSRFDGIEFKTYYYDENVSSSTGLGWVNQIICDSKNRLWFAIAGLENTFMQYDYETDKFIDFSPYIREQLNIKKEILDFWNICVDSDGYIWFAATNQGFTYFNPATNEVESFSEQIIAQQRPKSFFEDADKNMWFATSQGAIVYHKSTGDFKRYKNEPKNPNSLSSDNCNKIFQDSEKNIWIGTYKGLNKLVLPASSPPIFEHFMHEPQNPYSLSNDLVYDIAEDGDGNLLISTVNGLCLMEKETDRIYRYFNDELDNKSINSNLVRSVFRDNQDNIWIATNAGIGKLYEKDFKSFTHSFYENGITHGKVQYLSEAYNSDIWIATPKGIDVFNRKSGKFHFLAGVTQNAKGLYGAPLVIEPNANKGMWIGTWNGGLSQIDYATNTIKNFINAPVINSETSIFSIFTDSKENLWISASGEGMYVFNKKTGKYKRFFYDKKNENTLSSNRVRAIIEDNESNIWIGTLNGLNMLLDFETGSFKSYFPGIRINYIHEGADKNIWVGTNIGLYRLNKKTQKFKKFDIHNGLPGNVILGIIEEQSQLLWISSDKGLSRLTLSNDSLINITTYRKEEGPNIGEFLDRSCVKLSDGTMLFGGSEGFCMFNPSQVKIDTLPPKVVFTGLKISNRTVKTGQKINGQIALQKPLITTKHLVLNHKNNDFTIEFASIQYNLPQYNQFCYRLNGYDSPRSDWHYVSATERKAEYMNLPSGNYTFEVKAANSHGIWNNQVTELKITILPPWWKTKWFTALWIFTCIGAVFLFIRLRTRNLQKQKQKLKILVEQQTQELKEMNFILSEKSEELKQQMEQLAEMNEKVTETNRELRDANYNLEIKTKEVESIAKKLHEADQSKLRFFANISHEFRTPLSLIISPLEKCLSLEQPIYWNKTNLSDYLQLMYKNSKRLLKLINQVIDFRKIDQDKKELKVSNNNIVEFTKEVIDAFSAQTEQKKIDLNVESQYSTFEFWFDADIMEKILYNLISNAIKYTPEGGSINVELIINNEQLKSENTENDQLLTIHSSLFIKVSDTGIGIKKENLDKIFDRFYREETNENYTIEGTGIGLAYTKELIELHKGSISAESEPGKGTSFTLQFPIDKEHYNTDIISDDSMPASLNYIRSMIETSENTSKTQYIKSKEYTEEPKSKLSDKKQTILIVEDNADLREFIKNELNTDYLIYEATNGKEGLELALQNEPELIISDVMMPIIDGIELCKRIKTDENTSHIPVILLTAKEGEENTIHGLKTGADDYITKPFNVNILKIKIQNLFVTRKKLKEKFSQSIDVLPSDIAHSLVDEEFIQKAIKTINDNLDDYNFDNDTFVDLMNYGRSHVYKKIKTLTDLSVSEFIRSIRLKTAAQLFLKGNNNVSEVCYKVGFKYPSTFIKYFSKMFGSTPKQFILNNSSANPNN